MIQYLPFIGKMVGAIFGSKEKRDQYDADSKAAAQSQFAAEFGHSRNWFDTLIDGLNRLPRPVFAFGTIYLFYLCWSDPDKFVAGAKNLELMPYEAWWILGTIVVFFFGGRLTKDFGKYKIKDKVLEKYRTPSARTKAPDTLSTKGEEKDWSDRVKKRYKYENLND